ncbi:MAG: glycosyltransferase [Methanomassiliicoccales archaeon]|nr:glycosyltransferase [Methanomassiliicoccales archaeon]
MKVSVVLTLFNEERNIADLLDSLVIQEGPLEIIAVDARSRDGTKGIVESYAKRFSIIKCYVKAGKRGASRNYGVERATGEIVAFIDGDCIANPFWLKEMRESIRGGADVVAGKTISMGLRSWEELDRVELNYKGFDLSYPSCNIAFRKQVLDEVGGFDDWFITAEDIDLNLRAVQKGHSLVYDPKAIVYHRLKSTLYGFFQQAFWNGAGRKQLTMKHGSLWSRYDPLKMFRQKVTFWSLARLIVAMTGYVGYKLFGGKRTVS